MTLDNRFTPKPQGFLLLGDPNSTDYVEKLLRLSSIVAGLPAHQRPTRMYLSAEHFGAVIAEMRAQRDVPWSASTPNELIFGKNPEFWVINAGTNDEATVNRMNRDTPGAIDFEQRVRQFKGTMH